MVSPLLLVAGAFTVMDLGKRSCDVEQMHTRRRIALVAQPYQELFPPAAALGIWMREIAPRPALGYDVVVHYLARRSEAPRRDDGVDYRSTDARPRRQGTAASSSRSTAISSRPLGRSSRRRST
jgi:hypothetical protein